MRRLHHTLFISLSMLALSACQSVADDVRNEEPTCNNIQAQCLIAWDRYLNLTESAYQTCMSHSGRCEELETLLSQGRENMVSLVERRTRSEQ